MTHTDTAPVPNHHHDYPGFAGPSGLLAALSMAFGRAGDARLAMQLAGLDRTDAVVDIGCGPGTAARRAAARGASVTGVEPAAVMRRVAGLLTRGAQVRYEEGAAEDLPLPDDSATVAWSIACVHHWRDLDRGLAEVRRVLRPGGRFVAIERHSPPDATGLASHGWTDDQAAAFAELCAAHGFVDARVTYDAPPHGRRLVAVHARID